MPPELLGGETIVVVNGATALHTFRRLVSEAQQRHHDRPIDISEAWSEEPDDIAAYLASREEPQPDTWILITPMTQIQRKKVGPPPGSGVDLYLMSLDEQGEAIRDSARRQEWEQRVNSRAQRAVEIRRWRDDDGRECEDRWYTLGPKIPRVLAGKMWRILDGIARTVLSGQSIPGVRVVGDRLEVEADTLSRLINETLTTL